MRGVWCCDIMRFDEMRRTRRDERSRDRKGYTSESDGEVSWEVKKRDVRSGKGREGGVYSKNMAGSEEVRKWVNEHMMTVEKRSEKR